MQVEPATRRANLWLFVGLVAFAIVLCAVILWWMRTRTHAQGGRVYPPVTEVLRLPTGAWAKNSPVEIAPVFPLVSPPQTTPVLL